MEGIALLTPNVFQCNAEVEFVKGEKMVIHVQNIQIAILICTVNKVILILIFQPAKIFFLHMKLALIHINANIHFFAGILLPKKPQIIIN